MLSRVSLGHSASVFIPSEPPGGRLTQRATVGFCGAKTKDYEEEQARLTEMRQRACDQVYYESGDERVTGLDILKALKKAGYKRQLNPLILFNPISWFFKIVYASMGDGFSQRVLFHHIVNNLSLRYQNRSRREQSYLESGVKQALTSFRTAEMVDCLPGNDFLAEGWRPLEPGNKLLRKSPKLIQENLSDTQEPTSKELAPKLKKSLDDLIRQKHTRGEQLAQKRSRIEAQKAELEKLQTPDPQECPRSIFDQALHTQLIEQKQEMIAVLSQQYNVTEALIQKQDEEANQVILKLHRALHQIAVNTEIAETLTQTHQLQEKAEMDKTLAMQLAQVQVAYNAVCQALETEDPGKFISLMQKVQRLYQKLEENGEASQDLLQQLQQENAQRTTETHSQQG